MKNEVLKERLIHVLKEGAARGGISRTTSYDEERENGVLVGIIPTYTEVEINFGVFADTLIAAGLRFGESLTATFDHMAFEREHELERRLAEAERHAEVAARMAKRACDIVFSQEIESEEWDEAIFNYKKDKGIREIGITPNILYDYLKAQAEKELTEEKR